MCVPCLDCIVAGTPRLHHENGPGTSPGVQAVPLQELMMRLFKKAVVAHVVLLTSTAVALVAAQPASASTDDSFSVDTGSSPSCARYGSAAYIDYGEYGDDYVGVYDACKDGHPVKAWVWINGVLKGAQRNGSGFNTEVYFDIPNVTAHDRVGIKVCAQNGPSGTPFACGSRTEESHDG
jgi:hypothetical protein